MKSVSILVLIKDPVFGPSIWKAQETGRESLWGLGESQEAFLLPQVGLVGGGRLLEGERQASGARGPGISKE